MIGHGGLFFSFTRSQGVLGLSRGFTPRHTQIVGDLGFAENTGLSHSSDILRSDGPRIKIAE